MGAATPGFVAAGRLESIHAAALSLVAAQTSVAVAEALLPICVSTMGAAGAFLTTGTDPAAISAVGVSPPILAALGSVAVLAAMLGETEPQWCGTREAIVARYPTLEPALRGEELEAWAIVPLRVGPSALGVLAVIFASPRPFAAEDRTYLATLGVQAATALDRLRHAEVMERQARRAQALAEASQAFGQTWQDLDAVLAHVVRRVSELVGGSCTIRLIDADGVHVRLAALYHPDEELAAGTRELLTATPQRVDEGLARAVLRDGTPVLLSPADLPELRASVGPAYHAHLDRWPLRSLLMAPLRTRAGALGLVSMARYAGEAPYTPDDQTFLMDLADRAALAIANVQLYASAAQARATAEQAAAQTLRLQTLTSSLAEALTPDEVMELVAAQVNQFVGVASGLIGLVSADGRELELVQMVGYGPEDLRPWRRMPLDSGDPGPDVVRSGVAQFWETPAAMVARYPHLAQATLKSESWAIVPLRAEGRTIGILSLGFTSPRTFPADERALLELLAQQCATAVQRTARYQAVEQARAAAEHAADRTTRLYAVTAALAEALSLTEVAGVIVHQGVAALGAIAGSVRQLSPDGGELVTLDVVGYPPDLATRWQTIPLDAPVPMAEAARTARPILIESETELATSWPQFAEAMAALRYKAVALLPLMVAGRPIGTMSFGFAASRVFDAADRGFLDALAHQCALALERARLYAATQAQAARLGALAEASQLFAAASLDLPSVLDAIAWRVAQALGDLGVVGLLSDERDTLRLAAIAHANAEAREVMAELLHSFPLSVDEGISSLTLRTGQPQLLAVISEEQQRALIKPEYWPYLDRFGIYSLMVVPLRVNGEVIGTLGALRDSPGRPYTGADLTLLQELADRAALAVANARLYQRAREAIQIRDQFLSIAAHELKTPLTALSGQTQLVQRRMARGEQTPERLNHSITVIARQVDRLDVMVRTLLDVGRIERGQFVLERQLLDLVGLVERVVDEVRPDLDRHTLIFEPGRGPLIIDGDALRLEQVFQNLISNAVKYSPGGGTITVQLEAREGTACVTVTDEGVGIPTEALPQLFQRFYRAPNVAAHHISGMGIGLYVVREIVARHGGTVGLVSAEGAGSTFTICLPALEQG